MSVRDNDAHLGGSAVWGPSWRRGGVAEEARTRGFATPAFTGCAFVEGWTSYVRWGTAVVKCGHGQRF
jgi:hypothetical protein